MVKTHNKTKKISKNSLPVWINAIWPSFSRRLLDDAICLNNNSLEDIPGDFIYTIMDRVFVVNPKDMTPFRELNQYTDFVPEIQFTCTSSKVIDIFLNMIKYYTRFEPFIANPEHFKKSSLQDRENDLNYNCTKFSADEYIEILEKGLKS